ncbi:hypothetical protein COY52_10940 [Candidatus Desantisbacteria bacterium CG_4_10_14_0_8_um_filter_48_22]|uniref:Uncharacterized protein n=1 Tax=Candidatus Desantisbacteria bacterium CG_4_10_14_0_8_um_filter_48_22 TaxID=1974543 RepID=A0A2M7S5Q3_9BACT|nr:MAG: hypothetical protein COS16_02670 [Candidatus Desantisbacteria bacterium CG02_land_8_20_14_3_00_49_13]PIZ14861.1 MAG: hypothetical protein COY52_10940 [Candidatus Desantisbacteria bacterium CG_4_10_14_0_8_um_filter_48_22]PJB27947.1 MAG: hypothetical protein CO111_02830 [Candidatus Desantisbacteria bacterium CG_4_9_14_3_um_filter_50_7]
MGCSTIWLRIVVIKVPITIGKGITKPTRIPLISVFRPHMADGRMPSTFVVRSIKGIGRI